MTEGGGYGPYAYSDSPAGGDSPAGPGYGAYGGYPPPPPPPRKRGGGFLSHLAVAVLAAAVGIGATLALYSPGTSNSASGTPVLPGSGAVPNPGSGSGSGSSAGGTGGTGVQSVVNKVGPGVVLINSSLQYSSMAGAGTGMVINSDGLVLTNNHVIESSTKLSATVVSTGKTYPVTVLGYDKTGDIALIKLQGASGLKTVPLGDSSKVKTGDAVVALGNAQGQGTLLPAAGQITGVNKTITASDNGSTISKETLHGVLQTNASIVQGDSGGPLSNASGQVIGMDTAGDSVSMGEQAPASGFAIPINTALAVAKDIAAGKSSSVIQIGYPPFIGIFIDGNSASPDPRQQQQDAQQGTNNPFGGQGGLGGQAPNCYTSDNGLQVPQTIAPVNSGTMIEGVICGSPAAQAGLTAGAVITQVNGQAAGSPQNLGKILGKLKPGDTASITWVSLSGQKKTSDLHLVPGPPQ